MVTTEVKSNAGHRIEVEVGPEKLDHFDVIDKNRETFQRVIDELQRTKKINFDPTDMGICNLLPVGLTMHQCATGEFIYCNTQFATVLGYDQHELEWCKTWSAVASMRDPWDGYEAEAFRNFGQLPKLRHKWRHKTGDTIDGDVIPLLVSAPVHRMFADAIDLCICISIFDPPRRPTYLGHYQI
jgi:PAS domain-containing protein